MCSLHNGGVTSTGDLLLHVDGLLAAGEWQVAAVHVRSGAQGVPSREVALQWRELCERVPAEVRGVGVWPEALAWVGWRSEDLGLVREATQFEFPGWAVFEAAGEAGKERWSGVLRVLDRAGEVPGLAGRLGARLRAVALSELGDASAEEAFARALGVASGRDLGLVWLDLAYYRSRSRRDAEAREAYARALVWLRGDAAASTLAYANLGIACLRLNDLRAAELALREALVWSGRAGGGRYLSTVWRVAGGVGLQRKLPARAVAAFGLARESAFDAEERLLAVRGLGRALMAAGQVDQALSALYAGLVEVPEERHPLWLDVAAGLLRTGNVSGAREALRRAQARSASDRWRLRVLEAELGRLAGEAVPPDFLSPWPSDRNWVREETQLFPELFALVGVTSDWGRPRGVVVTDGPVRLLLDGVEVTLAAHKPAAALLAFLAAHGGASQSERVLEALRLSGKDRRAQLKELSRVARDLSSALGWREAVVLSGGLVRLTSGIDWAEVVFPPSHRADLFCEGRFDPWVLEWRQDHLSALR